RGPEQHPRVTHRRLECRHGERIDRRIAYASDLYLARPLLHPRSPGGISQGIIRPTGASAMSDRADIVIIGTGAGGGTLARALSDSGAKILLVERGDFLPQEPQNWNPEAVFL